jgi:hypothetical protein
MAGFDWVPDALVDLSRHRAFHQRPGDLSHQARSQSTNLGVGGHTLGACSAIYQTSTAYHTVAEGTNVRYWEPPLRFCSDTGCVRPAETGFQQIFQLAEEVCDRADQKRPAARDHSGEAHHAPADWRTLCRVALQEGEIWKLPAVCERARRAVIDRICELGTKATRVEREELDSALRKLCLHECKC